MCQYNRGKFFTLVEPKSLLKKVRTLLIQELARDIVFSASNHESRIRKTRNCLCNYSDVFIFQGSAFGGGASFNSAGSNVGQSAGIFGPSQFTTNQATSNQFGFGR